MSGFQSALWSLFDAAQPRSILDVGCGEGKITSLIQQRYSKAFVAATDIDYSFLRQNAARSIPRLAVSVLPDLCFSDASFDVVLLCEVLEHLDTPERALEAVRRVSRKYVIVSVPREPIWRVCNMLRMKYLRAWGNTPGHIQHFSPRSFRDLLTRHFSRVKIVKPFPWLMALCQKDA